MGEYFVGRQKELKELKKYLEEVFNFNGKTVLIKGETGVGKSALLKRFENFVKEQNLNLLSAKSYMDDARDYSPFIRILEDFIERLEFPRKTMQRIFNNDYADYLSCLVPKIKDIYPVEHKAKEKTGNKAYLHLSYYGFIFNLSKLKPVVLLIDDIQWMSSESLALLKYIVKRTQDSSILIVVTERVYQRAKSTKLPEKELLHENAVLNMELGNLTQSAFKRFMEVKFKSSYLNDFQDWLYSVTKGNPLFLDRILEVLMNRNVFKQANGEWMVTEGYKDFQIPKTIESVLDSHLSELSTIEKKIIENASVIGDNFDQTVLREFNRSISQKRFTDICENLSRLRLITCSGSSLGGFTHPLIRELIYKSMKTSVRRKTHRKLAHILQKKGGENAQIASHLTKDLSEDEITPGLGLYLYETAKDLMDSYNFKLSSEFIEKAKDISKKTDMEHKDRILIEYEKKYIDWRLGKNEIENFRQAGLLDELVSYALNDEAAQYCRIQFHNHLSRRNIQEAEKYLVKSIGLIDNKKEIYWILCAEKCLLLRRKGMLKKSFELSKTILSKIGEENFPNSVYKLYFNIGMLFYLQNKGKTAKEYLTKALAVAEENRFIESVADCLSHIGLIEISLGMLDSALSNLKKSLEQANALEQDQLIGLNLFFIGRCYDVMGKFDMAEKYFHFAAQKALKIGNKRLYASVQVLKVLFYIERDRMVDAEELSLKIDVNSLDKAINCTYLVSLGLICLKKSDYKKAENYFNEALKNSVKLGAKSRKAFALSKKALLYLKEDKKLLAMECYEKARKIYLRADNFMGMKSLAIDFGLELGGRKGEKIFIEGLELLYKMKAYDAITDLTTSIKKAQFSRALKKIVENYPTDKNLKIKVNTFGGLEVKKPGDYEPISPKEWKLTKTKELFVILLLSSSSEHLNREKIISELWRDVDSRKGRNNLRVALNQLVRIFGKDLIVTQGDMVKLDLNKIEADLLTFERAVFEWKTKKDKGSTHAAEAFAVIAVETHRGLFLPEFYIDRVIEKQREIQTQVQEVLLWLSNLNLQRIDLKKALEFARRLTVMDSTDEQASVLIMHCLYEQGDRVGALKHYDFLKKQLKKEFGIDPSPETKELYEKICLDRTMD